MSSTPCLQEKIAVDARRTRELAAGFSPKLGDNSCPNFTLHRPHRPSLPVARAIAG